MSNKEKIQKRMDTKGVITRRWAEGQGYPWPSVRRTVRQLFGDAAISFPGQEYRLAA